MHPTPLVLLAVFSAVSADGGVTFGGSVTVKEFGEMLGMAILDNCTTLHRACFTGQELQCDLQVKVYEQNQKSDKVDFIFCVKKGKHYSTLILTRRRLP